MSTDAIVVFVSRKEHDKLQATSPILLTKAFATIPHEWSLGGCSFKFPYQCAFLAKFKTAIKDVQRKEKDNGTSPNRQVCLG